jgi:hypothetical protein
MVHTRYFLDLPIPFYFMCIFIGVFSASLSLICTHQLVFLIVFFYYSSFFLAVVLSVPPNHSIGILHTS